MFITFIYFFLGVLLFKLTYKRFNTFTNLFFVSAYYLPGITTVWITLDATNSLASDIGVGVVLLTALLGSAVLITLGIFALFIDLFLLEKKR